MPSSAPLLRPPPTKLATELLRCVAVGGIIAVIYLFAQLAVGSDLTVALLFAGGVFAGVASIIIGGGIRSMMGLLNFSLVLKYPLLSLAIKVILLQPSDTGLAAPLITPLVLCLSFVGIFAGTLGVRIFLGKKMPLCMPVTDPNVLLRLYWLTFVVAFVGFLLSLTSMGQDVGGEFRVGGLLGFARYVLFLRDFLVAVGLFYAHYSHSRRFLTHPLVVLAFGLAVVASIGTGSKGALMNPILYTGLTAFILKGGRYIPFYVIGILGWFVLNQLIFPAINYTRTDLFVRPAEAGSSGDAGLYLAVFKEMLLDPNFRAEAKYAATSHYQENKYFNSEELGALARFALVGNADNLIAPTYVRSDYLGWETILWGIRMLPPRFLYKNKPTYDSSLLLSINSDMASSGSSGTPMAFGFFACSFNAFGLFWTLPTVALVIFGFYAWAVLFFGNPWNANVWLIFVVGFWHQSLCEYAISGLIAGLWYAVIAWVLYRAALIGMGAGGKSGRR